MKLMVAVPTVDYVNAEFMKCLLALQKKLIKDGVNVDVNIIGGTLVYIARERIAYAAVRNEYTHVLWLDSDMTFDDRIVEDLLFCGKEMVCGVFISRRPPYAPCIWSSIEKGNFRKVEKFGREPFQVAGCGFAAVLTSVELLKAVHDEFGTCFTPTTDNSEDIAFCERVKKLGREIWCDPGVKPGHIAHIPIYAGQALFGGENE